VPTSSRDETVRRIHEDYEAIIRHAAGHHVPEFLAIDVTMSQAKVLHVLALQGRAGMSALAAAMQVALPTMTGLIDRLVEQDLVARLESPEDRRQVLVELTRRGEDLLESFREVGRAELRLLIDELEPDALGHLEIGMRALAEAAARIHRPFASTPHGRPTGSGPSLERSSG
jgi:DNA-binding MarR family transcriptional regulator